MEVAYPAPARLRGADRRRELLAAAHRCFMRAGFSGVSMRSIAKEAGISTPALMKHFPTKDELLLALLDQFEEANRQWMSDVRFPGDGGLEQFIALAQRNAAVPGYVPLFTALAGEAASETHPAHTRFRLRLRRTQEFCAEQLRRAKSSGRLRDDCDVTLESILFPAGWDGLQLQSSYSPEKVDVVRELREHLRRLTAEDSTPETGHAYSLSPSPRPHIDESTLDGGYANGRIKRQRIVDDATELFSRHGFNGTSVGELALAVGVSKSSLFHHFASKEDLLESILAERDATIMRRFHEAEDPLQKFDELKRAFSLMFTSKPLVALNVVLAAEAAAPDHPAHHFFKKRIAELSGGIFAMLAAMNSVGILAPAIDIAHECLWLTGLWEGLQMRWLYQPYEDGTDPSEQFERHLDSLLAKHLR